MFRESILYHIMSTKSLLHHAMLNEWASRFADNKASEVYFAESLPQNEPENKDILESDDQVNLLSVGKE